ncbi:MAG: YfdX family protein [Kofleriaceae bacterium]
MFAGLMLTAGIASADDPKTTDKATDPKTADDATTSDTQRPNKPTQTSDVSQPQQRSPQEIMRITQQAMTHVSAAQTAIAEGDDAVAKRALEASEMALEKLYDTPPMVAVLNELDEAIASVQRGNQTLKTLDLAPLSATVRRYQAYIDPSVAAGIDEAEQKAKQGDAKATADALRLARNRIAIDVAFLPIEEAYVRVLAAQQALASGDEKQAGQFLQNLPIVVSEMQVTTPLVPVRFKLNAAALAAEEGNWKRSQTLLREATTALQGIERMSKGMPAAPEVTAIVDDVERLNRKMGSDSKPQPQEIRDLAHRTRDIGV